MKKNKKNFEKLIGKVNDTSKEPGSVAEFIELLQQFPENGKITLDGCVNIDNIDEEGRGISIYPKEAAMSMLQNSEESDCDCKDCTVDEDNINSTFIRDYAYGIGYDNNTFMNAIRDASSDALVGEPIVVPNDAQIDFETNNLLPNQYFNLDEIRKHNMYVAECLGELHRREISALLEYNTQCLAHFGVETNKTMCSIVEYYKGKNND